ncbi:unnamed protein product [Gulo gulo]|uniref:Uncharacterized protein n=1 Tax=Gulo gulo TaxID=48420 RepID=A0A9X9M8Y0_GULGU|nr:unnamed protein product [Gulo gulo]
MPCKTKRHIPLSQLMKAQCEDRVCQWGRSVGQLMGSQSMKQTRLCSEVEDEYN